MKNILLLTTYKGFLATSLDNPMEDNGSVNVDTIANLFRYNSYHVEISTFDALIDLKQYQGWFVLYASSEDAGLFYKDYIEDILLALQYSGAILLPDFRYFRAHHNKSFMELLRGTLANEKLRTISSRSFWCYDSMHSVNGEVHLEYPVVVKASAGSGSRGVLLATSSTDLLKKIRQVGKRLYWDYDIQHNYALIEWIKNLVRRLRGVRPFYYLPRTEKFIIQNLVEGLNYDYKVLAFGSKYYVLKRSNREHDFRASGSGKFTFPTELSEVKAILKFALLARKEIATPLISLDIGYDGVTCHLIEFQCLNFGPYTLQKSPCWFEYDTAQGWTKHTGNSILENEYVQSICEFINKL